LNWNKIKISPNQISKQIMAKILISPLGTGALNLNNTAAREYRTAKYRIDD
jgi:hypothetical protein